MDRVIDNKDMFSRFYVFRQNIAGGELVINDKIKHYIVIEDLDLESAQERLSETVKGFNFYCPCCGSSWNEERYDTFDNFDDVVHSICKHEREGSKTIDTILYLLNGNCVTYSSSKMFEMYTPIKAKLDREEKELEEIQRQKTKIANAKKIKEVEKMWRDHFGIVEDEPSNNKKGDEMDNNKHKIKDTGNRREFETGAVRDISKGKGRCDLMPLDIVERFIYIDTAVLEHIEEYKEYGDLDEICVSIGNFIFCLSFCEGGTATETIFLELSQHFEEGAKKYGENNWQKGIPISCYIDSGVRHYIKHLRGDKDERHDLAFLWNMVCLMWTHERLPEMIDIEFREKKGD